MNMHWLLKKSWAVIVKGPGVARNIIFSQFDFWPARPLRNEQIRNLPIYCLSLPTATRRRRILEKQVADMKLKDFVFVDAVNGHNLDVSQLIRQNVYDDAAANRYHHRSLTRSEIACSLSHGKAYEMIVMSGHEVAMIVEDDALFIPSRLDRVNLDSLPADWDIVFLNSFIENGRPRRAISDFLYYADAYTGSAAAYLVSRKGAQRIAQAYRPVIHAADGLLARGDFLRFMYYPDCVLNGSVCHYYDNTVEYIRGAKKSASQKLRL